MRKTAFHLLCLLSLCALSGCIIGRPYGQQVVEPQDASAAVRKWYVREGFNPESGPIKVRPYQLKVLSPQRPDGAPGVYSGYTSYACVIGETDTGRAARMESWLEAEMKPKLRHRVEVHYFHPGEETAFRTWVLDQNPDRNRFKRPRRDRESTKRSPGHDGREAVDVKTL